MLRPFLRPGGTNVVADPRPAAYVQEAHLRVAHARRAAGEAAASWLGTAFELPGRPDIAALQRALLGWIDRHETLRSVLSCTEDGVFRRTLPPGEVGLARQDLGRFDTGELASRLEDLFDAETDPLTWPSYVFAVVSHDDSFTVYVSLDHSNVDGYSVLMIAREVSDLYRAETSGSPVALGSVGSYVDFASAERRSARRVLADHQAVAAWRNFLLSHGGELPAFPVSLGAAPQTGTCRMLLDAEEASALEARSRAHGGSFMTGSLACLALAARAECGSGVFGALMSMHTRSAVEWAESLGWYVGLVPLRVAVGPADDFPGVLAAVTAQTRAAKTMAAIPFERIAELLGRDLTPRFVLSYMDLRRVPGADRWADWKAAALRSRSPHADEVYLWLIRSHEGLRLSARYPDTPAARTVLARYFDRVAGVLRASAPVPQPAG
ncbi:non-ribosomal peptide synthetase [Amycolatopsis bartoniae]|nr:non-ribosomal peptide synthetase [Amycolatopsis bartoniae]